MISNTKPCWCCCYCCSQCSTSNRNFYVQVKNQSRFYINIILKYTLKGKKITKPYPVFAPGTTQQNPFPDDSTDLEISIFNCFFDPPYRICNNSIPPGVSSCFKVVTDQQGRTNCFPVPC